jgi:ABC-type branched-subunit amino acid transport system ATPase component
MAADAIGLAVRRLGRRFGGLVAVDDVNLDVQSGVVHGLIGPNGAGKTTLLNLIAGAIRPTSGSILFEGSDITAWSSAKRGVAGIARTFQNLRLFTEMTVLENVMLGLHGRSHAGVFAALLRTPGQLAEERRIRETALETLDFVRIAHLADIPASSLAYGHRRLVEIARAMAGSPSLLLLDEPAAGLTRGEGRELIGLISRIRDRGLTLILVEHQMDVVLNSCQHITVLHHGRKLAEGSSAEIQRHPEVIDAYFGGVLPAVAHG